MKLLNKLCEFVFKYRYILALSALVCAVVLGLTGSSIGMLLNYYGYPEKNLLFGTSRITRSDEWAVLTPMLFSQYHCKSFPFYNDIIRGTATDVFLEYGQPIKSILILFKPFYIGYLFLPIGNGMAFFWYGRLIGLFMISWEFGRLITGDKRFLSMIYAMFITFSPVIQWWFAINGLVEMIMFAELSVIALDKYLNSTKFLHKIGWFSLICYCMVGYVFTMYPAWMIPIAYALIGLVVWVFYKNRLVMKITSKDILSAGFIFSIAVAIIAASFIKSWDAFNIIKNTVYPGARLETGGGEWRRLFYYLKGLFFYKTETGISLNPSEDAYFFDLFPLSVLIPIAVMLIKRKKDILSISLLSVDAVLALWIIVGFPSVLSKLTLFSIVQAQRAVVAFGFINIILLFHSISDTSSKTLCVMLFALGIVVTYTGLKVNPIRLGVSDVQNIPELRMVSDIKEAEPDALWVVEGSGLPYINSLLIVGAKTVNSTNVYPDLERWEKLDINKEYMEIYNRYAHISVNLVDNELKECVDTFEIGGAQDSFTVNATVDDLKEIAVKYIYTMNDYDAVSRLQKVDSYGKFNVYMLY